MIEYAPGTSAPPPERTTYRVTYAVAGRAGIRRADVTVLPGHSQESDIPGIIAARLTGRPADRRLITLLGLRPL
ncbi:hypothetical protein OG689_06555 [Kitasatospora sp. NBC_00240]|uniref:hypothetical protein n=1 Tax=Kitasatospora sp. NBC_00240 TaxID=2903567 RepID=UPI0022576A81|nr:hypothetical protein [Kitasatospora sp. NBC_00240]MCX5208951.1 hypothetical protein [Kitasatospora sp. NBC_00240]